MQLSAQQLQNILDQPVANSPVRVIWLEGKEALLIQETRDRLLQWLKQDIPHRQLHHVDQQFNWDHLIAENSSFGLFDNESVYDLRLVSNNLKAADIEQIQAFTQVLDQQKFVVISSDKLEKKTQQLKTFKHLQQFIGLMTFWPVQAADYPRWIQQYAQKIQLQLTQQAKVWLGSQHEGNLLALKQCLDRIAFTCDKSKPLDITDIQTSTIFQAKYTTFDIADYAAGGQTVKALVGLRQLREQGEEPILILWALNNTLEALAAWQSARQAGQPMPWPRYKVFGPRIKLLERTANKLSDTQVKAALRFAGAIDKMIKGAIDYDIWQALNTLALMLADPDNSALTLTADDEFIEKWL